MTINEYMAWKGLDDEQMAVLLRVSRVSVLRYRLEQRRPEWRIMLRLERVSQGLVMPNSFLHLKPKRGKVGRPRIRQ
jgi:predicted transcriptional regulator